MNTFEGNDRPSESQPQAKSRLKRLGTNLIVLAVSLLITCLVAELIFRVLGIGRPVPPTMQMDPRGFVADADPELVFTFRPGYRGQMFATPVAINSLGIRDEEEPQAKAPNEFRLLMLGDSVTYGLGVPLEKTFTKVLERLLAEADSSRRYRACNAGVPAYNTGQEYRWLTRLVEPLQPDLVVLNFTPTNDYETPYRLKANGFLESTELQPEDYQFHAPFEGSLGRISYVYRFAAGKIRQAVLRPRNEALTEAIYRTYRKDEPGWRRCKEYLLKIKALCDDRGIGFAVFVYPEPTRKPVFRRADYRPLAMIAPVEEFCRKNDIVFLDFLDDFLAYRNKRELWVSPVDAHPSAIAHEMVARGLMRELRRLQLLPNE